MFVCHFPTTSCHISTLLRNESRGFHRKCGLVLSDPLRSSEILSDPPRSLNFTKAQLDLVQPDEVTAPRLLQSREPHQTHHFTKPTLGLCPNLGHFPLFNTRTLPNLANFTPEFRLAPILNSPNSTTWAASKPTGFLVGGDANTIFGQNVPRPAPPQQHPQTGGPPRGRLDAGWRQPGGRLEASWRQAGGRLEADWTQAGRTLEADSCGHKCYAGEA